MKIAASLFVGLSLLLFSGVSPAQIIARHGYSTEYKDLRDMIRGELSIWQEDEEGKIQAAWGKDEFVYFEGVLPPIKSIESTVYYSSDEKDWKTYDTRITVDYYEFRHMSLVEKLNMYRSESVWVNVRIPFARNYPKEAVELLQKGVAVRGVAKGELKKDGYIWRLEVELMLSRIGGILVDKMWDK